MIKRSSLLAMLLVALAARFATAQDATPHYAGPTDRGYLLPNGWTVSPAGDQVILTDMVLNIIPLADNKHALVAASGYNAHELSLIDLDAKKVVTKAVQRQSWFGLAFEPKSGSIWWAGGGADKLHTFSLKGQEITATGTKEEARPTTKGAPAHFRSGLTLSTDGKTLYSLDIDAGTITSTSLDDTKVSKTAKIAVRPYDVIHSPKTNLLYVSDWVGLAVLAVHPTDLRVMAKIAVGEHPNQLALHPKDARLFVSCASSNNVAVIDTKRGHVVETIVTSLFPQAPEGSTPDAVAVSPDGETLYVANADNNNIAVIDIETPSKSQVKGFIPTGWYPTAVSVTPDGKKLLVGVGKGNQSKPNPRPKGDGNKQLPFPYIGTTLSGALSIVNIPDEKALAAYTETVYKNCPYADRLLTSVASAQKTAIPNKVGDPSPIKHVLYIIKENRTYDQVFSDIPKGKRDASLLMFGEEVTPNHHKLANEYVLLDNLYCNGQVSADGHPWSTMAYHTDYIGRNWALTYSRRKGVEVDDDGDLEKAPSGYLWDACARLGLSYRSYGEYGHRVSQPDGSFVMDGRVPGLVGHMCLYYGTSPVKGRRARDTDNAETFIQELHKYEADGNLPRFMVMSLGEDHTTGTSPGTFTPRACVASNDLALGRIVEAISKSKYWPQTAIFVIEDDAQNGPDSVDAHRTIGLVISPYTKRHVLDSTQYTTAGMLRTIELILGIPPLSQYDAAATPMFNSFTDKADLTPYATLPARIDLNATNALTAYGADRSSKMDFSEYDKIDDFELNEILWRSLKGADAPVPPAVRRAIAYRPMTGGK